MLNVQKTKLVRFLGQFPGQHEHVNKGNTKSHRISGDSMCYDKMHEQDRVVYYEEIKPMIYTSRIHWVARGTGTPKDREEVNTETRGLRV